MSSSSSRSTQPASSSTTDPSPRALGRAAAALAVLCGAFGMAVMFWVNVSTPQGAVLSGVFALGLAAVFELIRRACAGYSAAAPTQSAPTPAAPASRAAAAARKVGFSPALPVALFGILQIVLRNDAALSVVAGLMWIVVGILHLMLAWLDRKDAEAGAARHPFSSDWLILGAVSVPVGIWLTTTSGYGPHGQLSIAGTTAFILAVFWGISAVGLIRPPAQAAEHGSSEPATPSAP